MKVAIIGGGVMGEAILAAALERGVFAANEVTVCEKLAHRADQLHGEYGVLATASPDAAMEDADLVVLSVKPQDITSVHGAIKPDGLLLSIMAGVRIRTIINEFRHDRIVRVMPNTPVAAKAGMSVWTATPAVSPEQRELTRGLLCAIGRDLYVEDEKKLDMATAVSGSGPGYVFLFIEALIEGGVAVGLTRAEAAEMVLQTVYGSAVYAQESGRNAAELRGLVTSPAGTTAAGLLELEKGAVRASIIEAVQAAHRRAVELGGPA
ncbi:MAG TPA: pyrroline-5-carboxylate reductase [Tepidiformaceae bacterium]|jgi:pyrroline-5-carboxylate reductase|nr:pyrroline-5-carboxylate reductase [Tepidiformaceae bacterium]